MGAVAFAPAETDTQALPYDGRMSFNSTTENDGTYVESREGAAFELAVLVYGAKGRNSGWTWGRCGRREVIVGKTIGKCEIAVGEGGDVSGCEERKGGAHGCTAL